MRTHHRFAAAAIAAAALALPATSVAGPPDPNGYVNCDDAATGQPCVYWCPVNPGGGGGYYPCGTRNIKVLDRP
jgi:hypothetical protein